MNLDPDIVKRRPGIVKFDPHFVKRHPVRSVGAPNYPHSATASAFSALRLGAVAMAKSVCWLDG